MSLVYVVNPRKRSKKSHAKKRRAPRARKAAAPKRRRKARRSSSTVVATRRYKRNPRFGGGLVNKVTGALVPAAIGAAGAIAVDVAMGYLPIPERFKTGPLRHVTNGLAAVGVGLASGFVLKPEQARQVMNGGLTVAIYKAGRDAVQKFAPKITLAELEDDYVGDLEEDLNALLANEAAGVGALESDPFGVGAGLAGAEVFNSSF